MSNLEKMSAKDYRSDMKPIWCAGCGDYAVLTGLCKAFETIAIPKQDITVISGIGCSSRLPQYLSVYGYHTIHGRALAVATGLKIARPDLTVVTVGGDGDGFSIGGNHFIHSCRRNIDITYIVMDNAVYGMTKGQASPTTDANWTGSKLTPEGPRVPPFEPLRMGLSAGASFIARGFAGNPKEVTDIIIEAIKHPGFSLVQIVSPCVTWRPEHKEMKKLFNKKFPEKVTSDPKEARKMMLDDDGLFTGIAYQNKDAYVSYCYDKKQEVPLSEIEKQFQV